MTTSRAGAGAAVRSICNCRRGARRRAPCAPGIGASGGTTRSRGVADARHFRPARASGTAVVTGRPALRPPVRLCPSSTSSSLGLPSPDSTVIHGGGGLTHVGTEGQTGEKPRPKNGVSNQIGSSRKQSERHGPDFEGLMVESRPEAEAASHGARRPSRGGAPQIAQLPAMRTSIGHSGRCRRQQGRRTWSSALPERSAHEGHIALGRPQSLDSSEA